MIFLAIAGDTLDTLVNGLVVLSFGTSAERALITDDTGISAYGIAVNGVVDRAVAYAGFLHAAYDLLKSVKVLERIAVKLDIADMSRVC